jgi:predicted RNase H-like HicB family nuclease
MPVQILDGAMTIDIYFDPLDSEYEDDICLSFVECCPEEEKVFSAGETNLYVTRKEAQQLIEALLAAMQESEENNEE